MKTIEDLIDRLREMRDGIIEDAEEVSQKMAMDYKEAVVRRLQNQGIEGETYSDAGVPAYFYLGFSSIHGKNKGKTYGESQYARLDSSKFERLIKDKIKKKELVSWKDVRSSQGLQVDKVDFTFTGMTLKNLTIVNTEVDDQMAISYLGATKKETKDRLRYGYEQYGDFLKPNQEERKFILDVATKEFKKRIKKYKV